jgi:hypothetical protein
MRSTLWPLWCGSVHTWSTRSSLLTPQPSTSAQEDHSPSTREAFSCLYPSPLTHRKVTTSTPSTMEVSYTPTGSPSRPSQIEREDSTEHVHHNAMPQDAPPQHTSTSEEDFASYTLPDSPQSPSKRRICLQICPLWPSKHVSGALNRRQEPTSLRPCLHRPRSAYLVFYVTESTAIFEISHHESSRCLVCLDKAFPTRVI